MLFAAIHHSQSHMFSNFLLFSKMPPKFMWVLSEAVLKQKGVDVQLLRQGVHPQLAGNGVSLQVMVSLSILGANEELSFWYSQLEGVNQQSLSSNRGTIKLFIDGLKELVRSAQVKKDPVRVQQVLAEVVTFPRVAVPDPTTVTAQAALAEEHRRAEYHQHEAFIAKQALGPAENEKRKALRREQYAKKRKLSAIEKHAQIHAVVLNNILQQHKHQQRKHLQHQLQQYTPKQQLHAAQQQILKLTKQIEELKCNLNVTKSNLNEAHDLLCQIKDEIDEGSMVLTKDGCEFSSDMRLLVMKLISAKVPFAEVGPVIVAVSSSVGVQVPKVPSVRTVARIAGEELTAVNQQHLAEVLPTAGALTLMSDETSKQGKQSLVCAVSTEDGSDFLMSLRELGDKSGCSMLQVLNETLRDLGQVSGSSDPENFARQMFLQLQNTMSDRASTCVKLNELISSYRNKLVPKLIENWDKLDVVQQAGHLRVRNFFCGLHLLVNFADTLSSVMKEFELTVSSGAQLGSVKTGVGFQGNRDESGVVRLVCTLCKAFANHGGKDNVSDYSAFQHYLKRERIMMPKLANFKGNRFNILFYNAGVAFLVRKIVQEFVKATGGDRRLNQSIADDLAEVVFIAELKVLGLIGKTITSPFWRVLEEKGHISALSEVYEKLLVWLEAQAENPAEFLEGASPFTSDDLRVDEVYLALIAKDEQLDDYAFAVAKVSLLALANYLRRAAQDQLPGGDNHDLSADFQSTSSVPRTNKFPETIFGFFDHLMRSRPNSRMIVNEALIMFIKNRTGCWLESKSAEELKVIMARVRETKSRISKEGKATVEGNNRSFPHAKSIQ